MALAFRNLTIAPDAPISQWPTEAVQTALERRDLADWHRITTEIQADPWGETARQVEEVLSHSRPYGVAEAMETVLYRAPERAWAGPTADPKATGRVLLLRSRRAAQDRCRRVGCRFLTAGAGRETFMGAQCCATHRARRS